MKPPSTHGWPRPPIATTGAATIAPTPFGAPRVIPSVANMRRLFCVLSTNPERFKLKGVESRSSASVAAGAFGNDARFRSTAVSGTAGPLGARPATCGDLRQNGT